jgi:hypothetical protein
LKVRNEIRSESDFNGTLRFREIVSFQVVCGSGKCLFRVVLLFSYYGTLKPFTRHAILLLAQALRFLLIKFWNSYLKSDIRGLEPSD